jgi:hypothetical protein
MKEKEITIAGKKVHITYCYATEIAFTDLAGKDIQQFFNEITNPTAATQRDVLCLIIAAATPYYAQKGEEVPLTADDIMYNSEPADITKAVEAIIMLRAEWYKLPASEEKKDQKEKEKGKGKGKNS